MRTEVNINADILTWAIARAGYKFHEFTVKVPKVQEWIDGKKKPTVKQLEDFSKKVYLPFGYLFLSEPPKEDLPIPFFRTKQSDDEKVSINVYDTVIVIQQRQEWLKEYLRDNGFAALPFVGKYRNSQNVNEIVNDIRSILGLNDNWAGNFKTWQESLEHLTSKIEEAGIIVVFNGVVENNTHRPIAVDECRGFVMTDDFAPFMFINNSDAKAAQMFTIVHELAHIWTGHSAGFDFRKLEPANDPVELLCDKVAAEFLVPEVEFGKIWEKNPDIPSVARYFKVSKIVVARRALDTNRISKSDFYNFYKEYVNYELENKVKSSGGDFYATTKKRLSMTFAAHVYNAVKSEALLYRDAYKLTSMKGDTFQTFFTKHF